MSPPVFFPVILAGGSGERFWPLSRKHRPKQFLTLDETGRSHKLSTDHAILGKAEQLVVIRVESSWAILGDWNVMACRLKGEGQNALAWGSERIATIRLKGVSVRKDRTQDIKRVVEQLKAHPELERFA